MARDPIPSVMEYYSILKLTRGCTAEDIKASFRKLSLQCHPEKNPDRQAEARNQFTQVCEAFEVLVDPKWRAIYDQFGEDGLKNGLAGGYKFSGDPMAIFQKFMGVDNPWAVRDESAPHQFFSKEGQRDKNPPQCQPAYYSLKCTLEEFFFGAVKALPIKISHFDKHGNLKHEESKELSVKVEFGVPTGTMVKFAKEGNVREDWIQGDVFVTLDEIPHEKYERDGTDVYQTVNISLTEALTGFPVDVTTLDDRSIRLFINEIVHPAYNKRVEGFGFPVPKTDKYGDLVLRFATTFPEHLSTEQQKTVKDALEGTYDVTSRIGQPPE